ERPCDQSFHWWLTAVHPATYMQMESCNPATDSEGSFVIPSSPCTLQLHTPPAVFLHSGRFAPPRLHHESQDAGATRLPLLPVRSGTRAPSLVHLSAREIPGCRRCASARNLPFDKDAPHPRCRKD